MADLFRLSRTATRDPAIEAWLDDQTPELGSLARQWFARMRRRGADVREVMHDGCPVACVLDAPFAYVNAFTTHVNVGFFTGAWLPDPGGLLEGAGKRMRHVKLKPGRRVDATRLSALIDAAYLDVRARLAADSPTLSEPARPLRTRGGSEIDG